MRGGSAVLGRENYWLLFLPALAWVALFQTIYLPPGVCAAGSPAAPEWSAAAPGSRQGEDGGSSGGGGGGDGAASSAFLADDPRFVYEGRWEVAKTSTTSPGHVVARADWPCSRIEFWVSVGGGRGPNASDAAAGSPGGSATLRWYGLRTRVNLTITRENGAADDNFGGEGAGRQAGAIRTTTSVATTTTTRILQGPSVGLPFAQPAEESLNFPEVGQYRVSLRKLTTAAPFGNGIGGKVLDPSVFLFYGIQEARNLTLLPRPPPGAGGQSGGSSHHGHGFSRGRRPLQRTAATAAAASPPPRRIEFLGASDTAGFCVDGTPKSSDWQNYLTGWKYENCDAANPGSLQRLLQATEISVLGIPGIGLTQNANAKEKWQLGPLTLPGYFNRTLQTEPGSVWNFSAWAPDLVVVSLGGNDFNHQGGHVPSSASFTEAYISFLDRIFEAYGYAAGEKENVQEVGAAAAAALPAVVSICGQGSPVEEQQDPDNNRCRPCPHVEEATAEFKRRRAESRVGALVFFILVPCDGSVVTGKDDIGCAGHKNQKGQEEVARFLAPRLEEILQQRGQAPQQPASPETEKASPPGSAAASLQNIFI